MRIGLSQLTFMLIALTGPTALAENFVVRRAKVEADPCATPHPAANSPAVAAEGAFCLECAAPAVSTTPAKLKPTELTEAEKHELEFLKNWGALNTQAEKIASLQQAYQYSLKEKKELLTTMEMNLKLAEKLLLDLKDADQNDRTLPNAEDARHLLLQRGPTLRATYSKKESMYNFAKVANGPNLKKLEVDLNQARERWMTNDKLIATLPTKGQALLSPSELSFLTSIANETRAEIKENLAQVAKEVAHQENQLEIYRHKSAQIKEAQAIRVSEDPVHALQQLRQKFQVLLGSFRERPTFKDCGLTPGEEGALLNFTEQGYIELNSVMRKPAIYAYDKRAISQVETLKNALKKFKTYQGLVRRGVEFPKDVLAEHQPGQIVEYKAFSSTSLNHGFARPHQLVIHSKTGRYIATYSSRYNEAEVLFLPGKFKVLSRTDQPGGKVEIVLEELTASEPP